jgi:integrase
MPLIRPSGRKNWYLRITYQEEGKERQRWRSLHTKERPSRATVARIEAEMWRDVYVDKRRSEGLAPIQHRGKAGEAVRRYVEFMEPRFSRGHVVRIKGVLYNVLANIPSTSLESWTFQALQRYLHEGLTRTGWAAEARQKPWSARTHNMHLILLHGFFEWCVQNSLAETNPTTGIKPLRQVLEEPGIHSREDVGKVLSACEKYDRKLRGGPWLERAVRIALHTGARLGELISAEWSWINLSQGRITFPGRETKSGRARIVPISPALRVLLEDTAATDRRGKLIPQLTRGDNRALGRALAAAGLPEHGWHIFRHDFISHALMAGVGIRQVQKWAGHASIKTTERYAHVLAGQEDEDIKRLPAW